MEAALALARLGWQVFPCYEIGPTGGCACREGANCSKSPGKHPRIDKWPDNATSDPARIQAWWDGWPDANLAVMTGEKSGLVVVDVDVGPEKPGDISISLLLKAFGTLPQTVAARTGSGGLHLLFRHPGSHVPNGGNVLPGLDVRADGGYVIAPPSNHASGARYQWLPGQAPLEAALAELPDWLLEVITKRRKWSPSTLADAVSGSRLYIKQILEKRIVFQGRELCYAIADELHHHGASVDAVQFYFMSVPGWNRDMLRQVPYAIQSYEARKSENGGVGKPYANDAVAEKLNGAGLDEKDLRRLVRLVRLPSSLVDFGQEGTSQPGAPGPDGGRTRPAGGRSRPRASDKAGLEHQAGSEKASIRSTPEESCWYCSGTGRILSGWPVDAEAGDRTEAADFRRHVSKNRAGSWTSPLSKCKKCDGTGQSIEPAPTAGDGERVWICARCDAILRSAGEPDSCTASQGGCGRSRDETLIRPLGAKKYPEPEEEADPVEIGQGENVRIVVESDGVYQVKSREDGDFRKKVIDGRFVPRRQLLVEGNTYYDVAIDGNRKVIDTAEGIRKLLDREGRIVAHGPAPDVVNTLLRGLTPETVEAYPTFGVYADADGKLIVIRDPLPVRSQQLEDAHAMADALGSKPKGEDLAAYFDVASLFEHREFFPAFGLAAVSPLALALRTERVMVPHVYHLSPESGLGKSWLASALSTKLFGRPGISGDALNSDFRCASFEDAACTTIAVDEAERIDAKKRGADLKVSAERAVVNARGNADKTVTAYRSRTVFIFTGNAIPFDSVSTLARLLVVRFESRAKLARSSPSAKRRADALYARLSPVGPALADTAAREFRTMESLLARVAELEAAIQVAYGRAFEDVRRGQAWAIVYLGLQIWRETAASLGVSWDPPSIAEFVREVVRPVDETTFELRENPLGQFIAWWASWRAKNIVVQRVTDGRGDLITVTSPKGEGGLWEDHEIAVPTEAGEKRVIRGCLVTRAVLREYNEHAEVEHRVSGLKELALAAADAWSIPRDLVLDPNGNPRPHRLLRAVQRVAFVPDGDPPENPGYIAPKLRDFTDPDEGEKIGSPQNRVTMLQTPSEREKTGVTDECYTPVTALQEEERREEKEEECNIVTSCNIPDVTPVSDVETPTGNIVTRDFPEPGCDPDG